MTTRGSGKSLVWRVFIRAPYGGTCKLCNKLVKTTGNTTNLSNHIKRHHPNVEMMNEEGKPSSAERRTVQGLSKIRRYLQRNDTEEEHGCPDDPDSKNAIATGRESELSEAGPSRPTVLITEGTLTKTKQSLKKQRQIDCVFSAMNSFKDGGARACEITNAILFMIAKDDLPLNSTEKEGLQHLLKTAVPFYKVPGRTTMSSLLDQKYDALSEIVKQDLACVHHVSVTTDIWTEIMNTRSYLGITLHFLRKDNLASITVGVKELDERHTAQYLSVCLSDELQVWGIFAPKVVSVVTDNGANIVKAVTDIFGTAKHLPCFAHTTNLLVAKIIMDAEALTEENSTVPNTEDPSRKNLISSVKAIISFFKQSVVAADELRKSQELSGLPQLKLKQSVPTRWNSVYYMLERFVELSETVGQILLKFPKAPPMISAAQLLVIKEVIQILKPFEELTKELSGDTYVTSSKVIPLVHCVTNKIVSLQQSSCIGQKLKDIALAEMKKRYGAAEHVTILALSTILDPRFKRIHFKDPEAIAKAVRKLYSLMQELSDIDNNEAGEGSHVPVEVSEDSLWSYHSKLVKSTQVPSNDACDDELKQYFKQPVIPISSDPIAYWTTQYHATFPRLSVLAKKYMCITATSVPSERLFSKAGNIMNQSRNRMLGRKLSKLLFLKTLDKTYWHL